MPLTGPEVNRLVDELYTNSDDPTLQLIASDLGINLPNLAPMGTFKERAFTLISHLNGLLPPRDRELLTKIVARGNAALRAVANDLLRPTFISESDDPHDAVLLGKVAFIARNELRQVLREFTNPSPFTTRVLVVRGKQPGGKSYSWEFLRHLAFQSVNAQAVRLRPRNIETPRELLRQALVLLGLDASTLPVLNDDPQLARIDALMVSFKGQIPNLVKRFWLVIDELNDLAVKPVIRETAFAMAQAVEELRPQNLWLALLGYNEEITDPELRHVAQDDAAFPSLSLVAKYLQIVAARSPRVLKEERATEIATLLYSKYPMLDKVAMTQLTTSLELMGAKLAKGEQP
jgi:hypothetical protein